MSLDWKSGLGTTVHPACLQLTGPVIQASLSNQSLLRTHQSDGRVLLGAKACFLWKSEVVLCVVLWAPPWGEGGLAWLLHHGE